MSTIKDELRKSYKKIREEDFISGNDASSCEKTFLLSDFYKNSDTLLIYHSFGYEQKTTGLITVALKDKKQVFLPRVNGKSMDFFLLEGLNDLADGTFGIKEPTSDVRFNLNNAVCIVPGLAFDKKGYRLGYGAGYYDKYLINKNGITTFGFCSGNCLTEALPYFDTDIKMDYIVYDGKILNV